MAGDILYPNKHYVAAQDSFFFKLLCSHILQSTTKYLLFSILSGTFESNKCLGFPVFNIFPCCY